LSPSFGGVLFSRAKIILDFSAHEIVFLKN
jgi:hypothetical protein